MKKRAWPSLLPTWVVLGAVFVAPLAIMFSISFRERGPAGTVRPVENWSTHIGEGKFSRNYRETLEPFYLRIFGRSLWIAALTTGICLVVS